MKLFLSTVGLVFSAALSANAASIFWAFQSTTESGSAYRSDPNFVTGFQGSPSISRISGNAAGVSGGGEASFFYEGTEYKGAGGGVTGSNSFGWNAELAQNFTGAGFSFFLNTTGLTDLKIDFSIRAAGAGTPPPTSFQSVEYRYGTGTWNTIALTSPTWVVGSNYQRKSFDLSSLDALEGQENLEVRFLFPSTADAGSPTSIRLDNIVITAVPELSAGLLGLLGTGALLLYRRRLA